VDDEGAKMIMKDVKGAKWMMMMIVKNAKGARWMMRDENDMKNIKGIIENEKRVKEIIENEKGAKGMIWRIKKRTKR